MALTLVTSDLILGLDYGKLTGTIPTWNQNTTGNADTATILATARNINSVAFDGSADITIVDATKLPLAGGTLTGALSGTSATFSSTVSVDGNIVYINGGQPETRYAENDVGSLPLGLWRTVLGGDAFYIQKNTAVAGDFSTATNCLQFTNTGAATFSGGVGIGTSGTPSELLHLETTLATNTGVGTAIQITSGGAGGDQAWIGVNKGAGNGLEISVENRDIIFNTGATTPFGGTEAMRITSGGNVGIGVTPFINNLTSGIGVDLKSDAGLIGYGNAMYITSNAYYNSGWKYKSTNYAALLQVGSTTGTLSLRQAASGTVDQAVNFTQTVTVLNNGNVGIGTTNPDGILNIRKDAATGPELVLTNNQYAAADNTTSAIRFQGYDAFNPGSANPRYSQIIGVNGSSSVPKRIDFKFYADATVTTPLSILQGGNVGIGTNSPSAKLSVYTTAFGGNTVGSGGAIELGVGSTKYWQYRLDTSGNLCVDKTYSTVWSTPLTINRSTGVLQANYGISFPTRSADVTVLDNYEEGTWTPTLPLGGTVATLYAATYVIIGKLLSYQFYISCSGIPSNSDRFEVSVPKTPSFANTYWGGNVAFSSSFNTSTWRPIVGPTRLYFENESTGSPVLNSTATGLTAFIVSGNYYV